MVIDRWLKILHWCNGVKTMLFAPYKVGAEYADSCPFDQKNTEFHLKYPLGFYQQPASPIFPVFVSQLQGLDGWMYIP
jgi:hypothetical protein